MIAHSSADAQATPEQVKALRHELGLDRPLPARWASWLERAAQGDLGKSFSTRTSVVGEIKRVFPRTLALAASAFVFIVVLAIPMGMAGALFHHRWEDQSV